MYLIYSQLNRKRNRISFNCVARSSDGVVLQMTLVSLTIRPTRVRACSIVIAYFHTQIQEHLSSSFEREVFKPKPDVRWFAKAVCTLFVKSRFSVSCSSYLSMYLTPEIALEVTKRLSIDPKSAFQFFKYARQKLSIAHCAETYSMLMKSLCQVGLHDSVMEVFDLMRSDRHFIDHDTLKFFISSLVEVGNISLLREFLVEVRRDGGSMTWVYNTIFDLLVKTNQVDEAIALFREHLSLQFTPDTCTFNTLIKGLCRIREVEKAFELLNGMERFNCRPDIITYNTLIKGCSEINEIERGIRLLNDIHSRHGIQPDVVTYTTIISGCCRLGRMEEASALFNEMISRGVKLSPYTFNSMINGFGKIGDMASAMVLFEKMPSFGCIPEVGTFTSLMDGCCRAGQVNKGLELWNEMNARNVYPNVYTFTVIIHALCKHNRLVDAREFVRRLRWSNIVPKPFTYNPVIDGFCKVGNVDEANVIMSEMEEKGIKPDIYTFTILILGHCMKGRIKEAMSIFNKMSAAGCVPDDIMIKSFVSCLLKAGMATEASNIMQSAVVSLSSKVDSSIRRTRGVEVSV